jgi:two-component system, OmpR family, alkaline phosphatase synthesis response regulator PhoP
LRYTEVTCENLQKEGVAMKTKILVVDDEEHIRELLKFNLEKSGYQVLEAGDGKIAMNVVQKERPALVILDLMVPLMDGLEVCRMIKGKQETANIAIIMLTAKNEEIDKILGLELGADDYMTKPFSPRELIARVKAVLRRNAANQVQAGELQVHNLKLNFNRYDAYLGQEKLELTHKEFELLKLFITNVGKVYTRDQLLEKVWGYEFFGDTRTVDVHIRHLRAKLESEPQLVEAIETVRGVGYRFKDF